MATKRSLDVTGMTKGCAEMDLSKRAFRVPLDQTKKASPLTWGQIKKFAGTAENLVISQDKPLTSTNLFVAMLAMLPAQVISISANEINCTNHTYWTYIPNPPPNMGVTWWDAPILVYVNESGWLPGPFDDRGPLKPEEEGRIIENYTVGVNGPPICMGKGDHCLKMNYQAWLSVVKNESRYHGLYLLSAYSFKTFNSTLNENVSAPYLPPCQVPLVDRLSDWVHWTRCRGEMARVLVNTSWGSVIDWSPFGSARGKKGLKDLYWHKEDNTIYSDTINDTIVWHAGGFSPPGPHLNGYPIQKDLWKLMAALRKINAWVGHMVNKSENHSLIFHKDVTRYTRSCVKLPYIFLKGPAVWNETQGIIMCKNCSLYNCINSSISFNISTESLYILRARTGLWLPVNLVREWQESLPMAVLQYLVDALKRSKRFVGMLIAAVMGIIAITATAAVAGVALEQSIQTVDYITDWHKNSGMLWSYQRQIDSEIADLQQAVVMLGDQLVNLQRQMKLHCDWNQSAFCVTSVPYNQSAFPWTTIKKHLLHHKNLTEEIVSLQGKIQQTFQKKLQ
ncbi:endogenous retrovirus group K member 6 Env polyprotein-like [Monodon monoceros]|uniref:Endogenous retrovirus group K member 6 Env polyprotein-like n=1 Tax=Monodon monoceros TaxID=40151 RepID=A0A8C6F7M1_MONMO|nr:endogenous retrovirus group K member 6 Env polyprotein-like [Monodon monoceros]XP_029093419.1 endogenous retrovirus group K member 6 Env polyprotein-like [Monodon monoceros]